MKNNKNLPFVSIITVNYNGKKYLDVFLQSAMVLNYAKDRYEIIVVDNASRDGSKSFVKKHFPSVKIVESTKNLGFGMGNNLGITKARGDLFFLVNNDTAMDKNSLKEIVDCYRRWSYKHKIGAVNAKLLLFDKYLEMVLKGAHFDSYVLGGKCTPINAEIF